jgi:hypothetical protein
VREAFSFHALNRLLGALTVVNMARVVFVLDFGDVAVQMLLGHRVMCTNDLTLENRKESSRL